jgi:hypothetical protein
MTLRTRLLRLETALPTVRSLGPFVTSAAHALEFFTMFRQIAVRAGQPFPASLHRKIEALRTGRVDEMVAEAMLAQLRTVVPTRPPCGSDV